MDVSKSPPKAGRSRKKKATDPLEIKRQLELVRFMNRWFARGKMRTQVRLHQLTGVATTTISDAFKPEMITNTENTLNLMSRVASEKEFIIFIAEYFPAIKKALDYAFRGRMKAKLSFDDFANFAKDFMDDAGNVRSDFLSSFKEVLLHGYMNGDHGSTKNGMASIGGKIRGIIVEVSQTTFQNIVDSDKQGVSLTVGGKEYDLHAIEVKDGFARFYDQKEGNWFFIAAIDSLKNE